MSETENDLQRHSQTEKFILTISETKTNAKTIYKKSLPY